MIKPLDCKHRWQAQYKGTEVTDLDPQSFSDIDMLFTCIQIKCGICGVMGSYTSSFYAGLIKYLQNKYEIAERNEQPEKPSKPPEPEKTS